MTKAETLYTLRERKRETTMPWIVSRFAFDSAPSPVATVASRKEANELIARLEAADPKGSLVFYSRVEVVDKSPTFRDVKSAALALALGE